MIRGLINFGLVIFLVLSLLIALAYFAALYDKISDPQFKNLRTGEFIFLGAVVSALLIADYFIVKRFIKLIRKS